MEFLKIIGIGFVTVILCLITKDYKSELSLLIAMSGGVLIFLLIVDLIGETLDFLKEIVENSKINQDIFKILLKIIGIGYITDFTASFCVDSGFSSIAEKIILAGKIVIFTISIPIFKALFELIAGLL